MVETVKVQDFSRYADFDNRLLQRQTRFGFTSTALRELPAIDLSPFLADGAQEKRERAGREVRKACIDIGFFYLTGHGIEPEELDELFAWGRRFFALPHEAKMALRKDLGRMSHGYVPIGGLEASKSAAVDLKELYTMGRELDPDEPQDGRYAAGRSKWPDRLLPGFREFMQEHVRRRTRTLNALLRAFALALELPEHYFDETHRYPGCSLVLNYYPTMTVGRVEATQWGIAPHTDYGTCTILAQDELSGLQVRNSAGEWIDVPPVRGTMVVNIADLLARWTNDLFVSSLHRASNVHAGARMSAPFFVFPHGTTEVRCLETCTGPGNPPRYEPVTADRYVAALVNQGDQYGRPSLSKGTAKRLGVGDGTAD